MKNRYSYDAWGRPRNPKTWNLLAINVTNALVNFNSWQPRFDRGYTGHEQMAGFGLINANARLYDPYLQRFLSPDNFVQAATNAQNYNRYSYCLNNPLKFIDPSGMSYGGPWYRDDNNFYIPGSLYYGLNHSIPGVAVDPSMQTAGNPPDPCAMSALQSFNYFNPNPSLADICNFFNSSSCASVEWTPDGGLKQYDEQETADAIANAVPNNSNPAGSLDVVASYNLHVVMNSSGAATGTEIVSENTGFSSMIFNLGNKTYMGYHFSNYNFSFNFNSPTSPESEEWGAYEPIVHTGHYTTWVSEGIEKTVHVSNATNTAKLVGNEAKVANMIGKIGMVAKGVGIIGEVVATGANIYNVWSNPTKENWARFGVATFSVSLNALNYRVPGLGTGLSIGLTITDSAGGLNWFYDYFKVNKTQ